MHIEPTEEEVSVFERECRNVLAGILNNAPNPSLRISYKRNLEMLLDGKMPFLSPGNIHKLLRKKWIVNKNGEILDDETRDILRRFLADINDSDHIISVTESVPIDDRKGFVEILNKIGMGSTRVKFPIKLEPYIDNLVIYNDRGTESETRQLWQDDTGFRPRTEYIKGALQTLNLSGEDKKPVYVPNW